MPFVRKGVMPPQPNFEANAFDPHNHFFILNTTGPQTRETLRDDLQAERDHYMATSLVAGVHPVTKEHVPFPGWERFERMTDVAITAAVAMAERLEGPFFVTIRGRLSRPYRDPDGMGPRVSDPLTISISRVHTDEDNSNNPPMLPTPERPPLELLLKPAV